MIEIDLDKISKNELATILIEKDKEIERLNNIIKEVREYIESDYIVEEVGVGISYITIDKEKLLEILDKADKGE